MGLFKLFIMNRYLINDETPPILISFFRYRAGGAGVHEKFLCPLSPLKSVTSWSVSVTRSVGELFSVTLFSLKWNKVLNCEKWLDFAKFENT